MITAADLRTIPVFADLKDDQLAWLVDHVEELLLQPGEAPFEPGASAEHMIVVLDGALQIFVGGEGQWRLFDTFRSGRVTGVLPYSRMTHFTGKANVIAPTRMALIHRQHFGEMLYRIPELGQRLISVMSDRILTIPPSVVRRSLMRTQRSSASFNS